MATTLSTTIICNADAISRGATAALARGPSPSKNALLNAMAAAIAGPGHDWGFVRNAPSGRLVQPGLAAVAPAASSAPAAAPTPASVWTVLYDEREDWARAPMVFASKEAALAFVAADSWWTHVDHPRDRVLEALADGGDYVFRQDDEDGASLDEDAPYAITISETAVEGMPGADGPGEEPEDLGPPSPALVHRDGAFGPRGPNHQEWDAIYEDGADLVRKVEFPSPAEWRDPDAIPDIRYARDVRITARIRAEAWVRDNAMEVDPEGDTTWEVDARDLKPGSWDNDYLRGSRNAPDWVRDWSGPFEIYVEFDFTDRPAVEVMKRYGYLVMPRGIFERIAMPELVERARAYEGAHVLWDRMDGDQGFMLVGDDAETLAREAADHFEITV